MSGRLHISRKLTVIFALLALAGTAGFVSGVLGPDPLRAWQAYLVNFLFWTGLSFGAVLFVAVLNLTGATWGRPLKRLAESFGAYLPVGFALFWVLYFGRMELFPWIRDPVPGKASLAERTLSFREKRCRLAPPQRGLARLGLLLPEGRPGMERSRHAHGKVRLGEPRSPWPRLKLEAAAHPLADTRDTLCFCADPRGV